MTVTSNIVDGTPTRLFIDGEWRDSLDGRTFPVEDPAAGAALCEVADGTIDDGIAALDAAVAASASWAATPSRERGELLRLAYESIMRRQDDLALLITLEMGKPLVEARAEVWYGAEFFRWFSEEAARIAGDYSPSPDGKVGSSRCVSQWVRVCSSRHGISRSRWAHATSGPQSQPGARWWSSRRSRRRSPC